MCVVLPTPGTRTYIPTQHKPLTHSLSESHYTVLGFVGISFIGIGVKIKTHAWICACETKEEELQAKKMQKERNRVKSDFKNYLALRPRTDR